MIVATDTPLAVSARMTTSGQTISLPANSGGITWDIPVTGADAAVHTWGWSIDGNSMLTIAATGDGAGSITSKIATFGTSTVAFPNGTVGAPGVSFTGTTGLYLPSANTLGFTAGGSNVLNMAADGSGNSKWTTQKDFYILPGASAGYNGYELIVGDPTLVVSAGFSVLSGSALTGSAQFSFRVGAGLTIGTSLRSDYQFAQTLWAVNDPNGNQMIYCYAPYFTHDFDHPPATDTEIYVQASVDPDVTNNEWGMFRHNRTNFEIFTGPNTGAGSAPATIANDIVFSPRGTERFRVGTSNISTSVAVNITGGGIDHDAGNIGFFAATPAAQQTSGANLTNNVTAGGTDNVIADYSDLTVYANDAAAIRNDIYQLARKLKQVNDALRTYGLLT